MPGLQVLMPVFQLERWVTFRVSEKQVARRSNKGQERAYASKSLVKIFAVEFLLPEYI